MNFKINFQSSSRNITDILSGTRETGVDTKAKTTKARINKWGCIKLKSFSTTKKTINKVTMHRPHGRRCLQTSHLIRGQHPKDVKNSHHSIAKEQIIFFYLFNFVLGYSRLTNNAVIISGELQRDSAMHVHASILPQTPLPSRLPHKAGQSSMRSAAGPGWWSILNIPVRGRPWWFSSEESLCQCRRHRFDPWCRKIPRASDQLSPCATTIKPALWNRGAATTESTHPRTLAPPQEKLVQEVHPPHLEGSPCSPRLEKSPCSNEDPAQSKIIHIF